jgi:hypothetical protein
MVSPPINAEIVLSSARDPDPEVASAACVTSATLATVIRAVRPLLPTSTLDAWPIRIATQTLPRDPRSPENAKHGICQAFRNSSGLFRFVSSAAQLHSHPMMVPASQVRKCVAQDFFMKS